MNDVRTPQSVAAWNVAGTFDALEIVVFDSARPEEVDIEFMTWFNKHQPLQQILRTSSHLTTEQMTAVRDELRQAFVHGYARGIAAEVARPPGLTR